MSFVTFVLLCFSSYSFVLLLLFTVTSLHVTLAVAVALLHFVFLLFCFSITFAVALISSFTCTFTPQGFFCAAERPAGRAKEEPLLVHGEAKDWPTFSGEGGLPPNGRNSWKRSMLNLPPSMQTRQRRFNSTCLSWWET